MAHQSIDQTEIRQLLPFHVNGTLTEDEAKRVDRALEADPTLKDEAAVLLALRNRWQAEEQPRSPGEFGLVRLMRDVPLKDTDTAVARKPLVAANQNSPIRQVLAIAAAVAVGAIGTIFVFQQQETPDVAIQASGGDAIALDLPTLTVSLADTALAVEVSQVLLENNLVIVDGPSAIGFYRLGGFDAKVDLAAAAVELRTMPHLFSMIDGP